MPIIITLYSLSIIIGLIFMATIGDFGSALNSHILLSLFSYGLLFAGFILSIILIYQQNSLQKHKSNFFNNHLPPLEKTENILFYGIYISLLLLSFAIITGFVFLEDMFAQHLVHKTFFAIIAWFLLFGISIARVFFQFKNKELIRIFQSAFILLLIGYFGTKLVLAII